MKDFRKCDSGQGLPAKVGVLSQGGRAWLRTAVEQACDPEADGIVVDPEALSECAAMVLVKFTRGGRMSFPPDVVEMIYSGCGLNGGPESGVPLVRPGVLGLLGDAKGCV